LLELNHGVEETILKYVDNQIAVFGEYSRCNK
jgi:hypothetical protein